MLSTTASVVLEIQPIYIDGKIRLARLGISSGKPGDREKRAPAVAAVAPFSLPCPDGNIPSTDKHRHYEQSIPQCRSNFHPKNVSRVFQRNLPDLSRMVAHSLPITITTNTTRHDDQVRLMTSRKSSPKMPGIQA